MIGYWGAGATLRVSWARLDSITCSWCNRVGIEVLLERPHQLGKKLVANLSFVLKQEISRLCRKEIRSMTGPQKQNFGRYRKQIAMLKRAVQGLEKRLKVAERGAGRDARGVTTSAGEEMIVPRFSSAWVKKHRDKLGISAADYGKLVGVSALTIYNWEKGTSSPRTKQLVSWGEVRALGKREVMTRLERLG